jgi:hypothetical protein
LVIAHAGNQFGIGKEIVREIGVHAHPGENANRAIESRGIITGIFEGRPRALKEHAMLRIHHLCFSWFDTEERRIEQVRAIQQAARFNQIAVLSVTWRG